MILQALHNYYERMVDDPKAAMPLVGSSMEKISFALVLSAAGGLQDVEDLREQNGAKKRPRVMAVPAAVTRTSGVKANFLWDKAAYVCGADCDGYSEQNLIRFNAFRDLLQDVGSQVDDVGFMAVAKLINSWDCREAEVVIGRHQLWEDVCNANLVFRLEGAAGFIHDRPAVQEAWLLYCRKTTNAPKVQCLVSGEHDVPLARVHTPIKGVRGGQTSGGYIVSFNATSFTSYGQDKAAVSENSAFAYTTALNALLAAQSRQKVGIGDMTMAFWAENTSPAEELFADLFDPPQASVNASTSKDDQQTTSKVRDLLLAMRSGRRAVDIIPGLDESVRFFILGLSPNAARLSVRFWETNSLGELLDRVSTHFAQLAIVRQFDNEPEFPPLWQLLRQTAALGKTENISPVLAGGMARAMLTGNPYPQSLMTTVLSRICSEHSVTYYRAALLKAFLVRNKKKEVSMSLNPDRKERPYLLGRLFAALEKAQEDAVPNTNATIKDRYLASASATPAQIFHLLLKNSAHHIGKLRKEQEKRGRAVFYEMLIQDIIDGFDDYPTTQSAEDQSLFMIGYYHQRKDFFTKKKQEA